MAERNFYVNANGNNNKLLNWVLDPSNDFTQIPGVKSIDSLSLSGNNLIIGYTMFDNSTGTKSVDLTAFAADVSVSNVTFTNPSAGVWNLSISEDDGTVHTVNLADLVAIITNDSSEIDFSGNGTAGTPLTAIIKNIVATKIIYNNSIVGILSSTNVQAAIDELAQMINSISFTNDEKWVSYRIPAPTTAPLILKIPSSDPMTDQSAFQISIKDFDKDKIQGTEIEAQVITIDTLNIGVQLLSQPRGELHIDVNYWSGKDLIVGEFSQEK